MILIQYDLKKKDGQSPHSHHEPPQKGGEVAPLPPLSRMKIVTLCVKWFDQVIDCVTVCLDKHSENVKIKALLLK